jgi:sugar/nucleoside kinase (ribokinase family)
VLEYAQILEIPTVPELARGHFSTRELQALIAEQQARGSAFGGASEGVVCRVAGAFPDDDFPKNVLKYVRKNHVQTDEHWVRNWKRAPLWFERSDTA